MWKTKLIAVDLDGTLLRPDRTISPRNYDAVRRAVKAGIHVILASGRMHESTAKYAIDLDFGAETLIISYNGAMVRTLGGTMLFETPLGADVAESVVEFCREHGHHLNYYLRDVLYTARCDQWLDVYFSRTGSMATVVGDLRRFAGERPTKALIIDHGPVIARLQPLMQARFDGRASILITDDEYLEFMAPEASKGHALAQVASRLGVTREECLAIGDNNNDLSMMLWAGRGVAMGNARPELLAQVAEHAPPVEDDGVARVIDSVLS